MKSPSTNPSPSASEAEAELDSVKYFRPEGIMAFGGDKHRKGDSLRTAVFQEIIINYLQYLKAMGFTSMYIWVCPPFAGDDYIFYFHPARQKTPSRREVVSTSLGLAPPPEGRKVHPPPQGEGPGGG